MNISNSHGFSMVEVICALAAAAILVAYTSIPFRNGADLEGAAKKLAMDVRYSRDLAMTSGYNCGLNHTGGASTYFVYQSSTATPVVDPLTQVTYAEDLKKFRGVSMSNAFQFEFDSRGKPVTGGNTTANLTDGTKTRQVQVVSNTGFVQIL